MNWQAIMNSSRATKRRYSFVVAGLFTGLVGIVWLVSLGVRLENADIVREEQAKQTPEPTGAISDSLADFFDDARARVDDILVDSSATSSLASTTDTATTSVVGASTTPASASSSASSSVRFMVASGSASTTSEAEE